MSKASVGSAGPCRWRPFTSDYVPPPSRLADSLACWCEEEAWNPTLTPQGLLRCSGPFCMSTREILPPFLCSHMSGWVSRLSSSCKSILVDTHTNKDNSLQNSLCASTLCFPVCLPHSSQHKPAQKKMWLCYWPPEGVPLKTKSELLRFQKAFQNPLL